MSTDPHPRRAIRYAGALVALALVPALPAAAGGDHADHGGDGHGGPGTVPRLIGRAVLPVDTYADGPPAGGFFAGQTINGISFPLASQPVEGFSAIVDGRTPGEILAMPDNGFGNKANSADFLIRAYYLRPDFETARGGSGTIAVGEHISFRDPDGLIGFPITNDATSDRLLTGADIDPESLQRGHDGDLWVGDEFGPWILHFDADGVLLEPPIALPDGLRSPANPFLGGAAPTVNGSRGIEAMAISPNGRWLTAVLEGAVPGDDPVSRRVYRYDTHHATFERLVDHRVELAGHFVSDVQALDAHRLLVLERDGGRGLTATFRGVYRVDLDRTDADGFAAKSPVVDLTAVPDPALISLPAIHDGDVGLGDPFRVACESIEALHVLSGSRLMLGCDNNFPNTGRNPNLADDNELIVVRAPVTSR